MLSRLHTSRLSRHRISHLRSGSTEQPQAPSIFDPWRKAAWSPPPELTIDRWADESVVLPRMVSAEAGPFSCDRVPYLREILRAATNPEVEEITLCFSTQVGKTTACILTILFYLDQDPWPCLHVMPREDDAAAINVDRYQKIIEESPQLRRHLTGAVKDLTKDAIRINGATATFVGANSPAALSSRAICVLVLDETDKYPAFSGQEADPIALARERTRTFSSRKIIKTSTPTTDRGYIWKEYQDSDRRRFMVPCPHCHVYQQLVMGGRDPGSPGIKWGGEWNPERIREDKLAWYECEDCHGRISDFHKPAMLRCGVWVPDGCVIDKNGKVSGKLSSRGRLGYHLSALYSPWLTWSDIAAEFLRSKDHPERLMNFRNSWQAEVWEDLVEKVEGQHIRDRIEDYRQGEVPTGAHMLTAGVDIQLGHIWLVIRAWGAYGESWLVRCGRLGSGTVSDFYALEDALFRSHYLAKGTQDPVPLELVFVDVGFAARKDEALQFCERNSCQPIRGSANPTSIASDTNVTDSTGRVHPLRLIDTGHFKSKLHRLIRIARADPGSWHIPCDLEEWYFQHMSAEQRKLVTDRKTGKTRHEWVVFPRGAANHAFDAEVYALAAAVERQVEFRFKLPPQRGAVIEPVEPLVEPLIAAPAHKPTPKVPARKRISRTVCRFFS